MKERWSVHNSGNVVTEDRYLITIPRTEKNSYQEPIRNSAMANLVAAAPDMLAALEAVAPHLNVWNEGYIPASDGYWTGDVPADVESAVERAIAKAKGEIE